MINVKELKLYSKYYLTCLNFSLFTLQTLWYSFSWRDWPWVWGVFGIF